MSSKGENRFESDASRYAGYLATPEGRLRSELAFANLQEFLPAPSGKESLFALDLGCGTGAAAVRLAQLGVHVTLFDSSPAMLDLARKASLEAGVAESVAIKCGDAARLTDLFEPRTFDIILCHNLLEFVDDPDKVLHDVVRVMRDSSAVLSLLVRNQAGEVLKAALQTGDLMAAERNLTSKWGEESLYGGKVRLFTPETVQALLTGASLTVIAQRGVRVISDYLPSQISRSAEYESIFDLESKLGQRQEFIAIARYIHCLARPSATAGAQE